jgi:uncharacterized protein (UPF0332 family)
LNEIEPLLDKAGRSFDVAEATLEQGHADFGLHFAKTKLDPTFHRLLSRAFQLRQGADYATSVVIEPEWVREILEGGRRFLAVAAAYLTPIL